MTHWPQYLVLFLAVMRLAAKLARSVSDGKRKITGAKFIADTTCDALALYVLYCGGFFACL
ncbi:MAG TPA: hypothetical protein VGF02_08100 [Pseudolabrys sp.]